MLKISGRFGAAPVITALTGMMLAAAIAAPAQKFKTLVDFDGPNGATPTAGLTVVQGFDGNLYGTTYYGGANGDGIVFRVTPGGAISTLYSFCVQAGCADGANPSASLMVAADGNFYGTTYFGGTSKLCPDSRGCGTIFRITPNGALTTLYSFCPSASCADGAHPQAALIETAPGSFYGTTPFGGTGLSSICGTSGCGTAFRFALNGVLTPLYSFCVQASCLDGDNPQTALVETTNGSLYGTTTYGGIEDSGTVFKIGPTGAFSTAYSFCGVYSCTDGRYPGGLIEAADGNLYGNTENGGSYDAGTIFEITPGDVYTTLYSFCAQKGCPDGFFPVGGLIQATDGNFYGTTGGGSGIGCGGSVSCGTAFEFTSAHTLVTLHSFSLPADGVEPVAGLFQSTSGTLYGMTSRGGTDGGCRTLRGCGTVFALSNGLTSFVEAVPASGRVGIAVKVLGNNLTGATSVTFNGIPAAFTVESPTYIKTSMPTGATTGPIQVTLPSGTLTSNVNFRVLP